MKRVSNALRPRFDPGDHPLDPVPTAGSVVEVFVAPDLAGSGGSLCGAGLQGFNVTGEHGVPRQPRIKSTFSRRHQDITSGVA